MKDTSLPIGIKIVFGNKGPTLVEFTFGSQTALVSPQTITQLGRQLESCGTKADIVDRYKIWLLSTNLEVDLAEKMAKEFLEFLK